MAKSSRSKARAVRSAKRTKQNNWWVGITVLVLILGVALIAYSRMSEPEDVGPYVADRSKSPDSEVNRNSHWHAALGVYDCDHWVSDGSGDGVWTWPGATQEGIFRVGTRIYAGMHSHADGIIHMEPAVSEEAGRHATVGKYFQFGDWDVSADGFDFLGVSKHNGDKCGNENGTFVWGVGKLEGDPNAPVKIEQRTGNPGRYKLYNDDVVVLAFLPPGKTLESIGNPPSVVNLPDAANQESQTPPSHNTTTVPGSTTPDSTTPESTTPEASNTTSSSTP